MRDYSKTVTPRKKIAPNKVKTQRQPLDLKKYLRPLKKVGLGFSALCVIGAAGYSLYKVIGSTTFCRLKAVEVSNTKRITREEILSLASIAPGQDMVRMNLKLMGEQITRNPWVKSVHIRRYYPDLLSLTVTEREPVAIVSMGVMYYLDASGTVFKVLSQGDRLDYPVITGFSEEEMGSDPKGVQDALKETCGLLDILQKKGTFILADVSEIHYDKGYGFTLFTASGSLPVKMGSGDYAAKLERFARIYSDVMANKATLHYIDLDYNDKIVVKKS